MNNANRIVFYDGECGFCNRIVQQLLEVDKNRLLYFAPLQGSTASSILPSEFTRELSSMVYYRKGKIMVRSAAAIWVLSDCAWYAKPIMIALLVPRDVRDGIYNWVAKNRHRITQRAPSCRLPDPIDRIRFLN
ncbi:MAG: thiol-disulfide oxidoreductase DCC family protein [Flavobacteriales bacterium]